MYQVLYRKFRPQTFSDVSGQETVTTALRNEIKNNRLAHAYLFTGCRGTGKTTCAKILAKAVNCLHPQDGDPCNECEICRGIDDGSILDVTEIDAASNNGVDSIRELREEVNFTPSAATYRVYIIDEVHMLSAGAFNALLKTLEEPPAHVIFILATTEVHKLPATILSRCQRFDFGRISPTDIAARIQHIAEKEGFAVTDDAALLLARLADGAMRDALSLLDQCVSRAEEITADVVAASTGMAGTAYLYDLSDAVVRGDTAAALSMLDTLYRGSKDMERLCAEWVEHYRNIMIVQTVKDPKDLIVASAAEWEQLRAAAAKLAPATVLQSLSVLQETLDRLRGGVSRRVEMEMAVLRLSCPELDTGNDALLRRIAALEGALKAGVPTAPAAPTPAPAPTPTLTPTPTAPVEEQPPAPAELPAQNESPAPAQPQPAAAAPEAPAQSGEEVPFAEWGEVVERLGSACAPLQGVLAGTAALIRGDIVLVCTDNDMFKTLVTRDGNKQILVDVIREVTGRTMRIGIKKAATPQDDIPNDPLTAFLRQTRERGMNIETNE